ncbi:hypothetical protein FH039_05890 [Thermococcus indicus]|uniref:Uncharacterized protein n=1 Tax=Thermococcus indicus TaxID=2586643 RepID=A0A4Y5SQP2_9EURY|nr:hypothetical protein [Thermococcus indicus]QDA32370.1 hypothetical protein FH039_05890 [Thermococcus indicus]
MESATKHVQTEIDESLYLMLKMIAIRKREPLKEVLREAIERYIEAEENTLTKNLKSDPIWKLVGRGELEENASESEGWGTVEWESE